MKSIMIQIFKALYYYPTIGGGTYSKQTIFMTNVFCGLFYSFYLTWVCEFFFAFGYIKPSIFAYIFTANRLYIAVKVLFLAYLNHILLSKIYKYDIRLDQVEISSQRRGLILSLFLLGLLLFGITPAFFPNIQF